MDQRRGGGALIGNGGTVGAHTRPDAGLQKGNRNLNHLYDSGRTMVHHRSSLQPSYHAPGSTPQLLEPLVLVGLGCSSATSRYLPAMRRDRQAGLPHMMGLSFWVVDHPQSRHSHPVCVLGIFGPPLLLVKLRIPRFVQDHPSFLLPFQGLKFF